MPGSDNLVVHVANKGKDKIKAEVSLERFVPGNHRRSADVNVHDDDCDNRDVVEQLDVLIPDPGMTVLIIADPLHEGYVQKPGTSHGNHTEHCYQEEEIECQVSR